MQALLHENAEARGNIVAAIGPLACEQARGECTTKKLVVEVEYRVCTINDVLLISTGAKGKRKSFV